MTIAELMNKVGFKVKSEDVKNVNDTFNNIKSTATKVLGAIGIGFSLTQINAMVEEFGRVNNQIKNSTKHLGDQQEIQQKILKSASDTRSTYGATAKMVSNLVHENANLFGTVDEAIAFNDAATMLFKTAGKTNEETAGLMESINKSFAKGRVDTETINQLLERSPEAVELLNKHLGTTTDQLESMASEGRMTVQDLKDAFVNNAEEIKKSYGEVQYTISDALTVIRNKWGVWLTDMDKTLGLTNAIGTLMVKAFDKLIVVLNKVKKGFETLSKLVGGTNNLLKLLTIIASAIFLAFNFSKILAGLQKMAQMVGVINIKVLAIIAIVILLALVVEDFIKFMKGGDSLFGTLLQKSGVDIEELRNKIEKVWTKVSQFLSEVWSGIKEAASMTWGAIKDFFSKHSETIQKNFMRYWGIIQRYLSGIWTFISQLMSTLFGNSEEEAGSSQKGIKETIIDAWQGILDYLMPVFDALFEAWNALFNAWASIIDVVLNLISAIWNKWGKDILGYCKTHFEAIKKVVMGLINAIKGIADFITGVFTGDWKKAWEGIKTFFGGIWDAIKAIIEDWFAQIKLIFTVIVDVIIMIWGAIVGFFRGLWDGIVGIFSAVGQWFYDQFMDAYNKVVGVFSAITGFFQGVWDNIVGMFTKIGTAVGDAIGGAFKNVVNAIIGFAENTINGFIKAINVAIGVINAIPGVEITKLKLLEIPRLAEGGYVEANKPRQVIIGDNKKEGEIVSPISKMRDTVLDALRLFSTSIRPTGSLETLGQSAINYVITQNIEINNKFEGDRAGQQKSSTAMNKAANDCTAELARGLAFAR